MASATRSSSRARTSIFHAIVEFYEDEQDPSLTVAFRNERPPERPHRLDARRPARTGTFHAGDAADFAVAFDNVLAPGRYEPPPNLAHGGEGHDLMDRCEQQRRS